jgi:hypothetical protein
MEGWRPLLAAASGLVPRLAENDPDKFYSFHVSFHRRRLPHWYRDDTPLFLTWHLHGSLPHGLYPPPHKPASGQAFVWMERYLDTTCKGPLFLRLGSPKS